MRQRTSIRLRSGLLVGLLFAAHVGGGAYAASASVELIYIEPNEGGASGGHAALKLGERVYHFQSQTDWGLVLTRDPWPMFRYSYNDLENRGLHLASLDLAQEAQARIEARFQRLYTVQRAHRAQRETLRFREALIEALLPGGSASIELQGAGLFEDRIARGTEPEPALRAVRDALERRVGPTFLEDRIRSLDEEMRAFSPVFPAFDAGSLSSLELPEELAASSVAYREQLALRLGLQILRDAPPLRSEAVLAVSATAGRGLSESERQVLRRFAVSLQASALRLLDSRRADRGFALVYTLARLAVVERSLTQGRLLVLDPFLADNQTIPPARSGKRRDLLDQLAHDARLELARMRAEVLGGGALDEWNYGRLEQTAARTVEILDGVENHTAIRMRLGLPLVARTGRVGLPNVEGVGGPLSKGLLLRARSVLTRYEEALASVYRYDAFRRNCVTELIVQMEASFSSAAQARASLGGDLDPTVSFAFVPARFFAQARHELTVATTQYLPSYRMRQLATLHDARWGQWKRVRESITLTSEFCPSTPTDSTFLFFANEPWWARPVLGALNTGYGLLQSGAGLLTLPFDGGQRMQRGMRGIIFSLPELAYLNLRKGHFEYISSTHSIPAIDAGE